MTALAFCIDTNRRDLENARMVTIHTKAGVDAVIPPCDNTFKEENGQVIRVIEEWGCTAFGLQTEIKVLSTGTAREEIEVTKEDIRKGTRPQIVYP